jgi:hypothetical protein
MKFYDWKEFDVKIKFRFENTDLPSIRRYHVLFYSKFAICCLPLQTAGWLPCPPTLCPQPHTHGRFARPAAARRVDGGWRRPVAGWQGPGLVAWASAARVSVPRSRGELEFAVRRFEEEQEWVTTHRSRRVATSAALSACLLYLLGQKSTDLAQRSESGQNTTYTIKRLLGHA